MFLEVSAVSQNFWPSTSPYGSILGNLLASTWQIKHTTQSLLLLSCKSTEKPHTATNRLAFGCNLSLKKNPANTPKQSSCLLSKASAPPPPSWQCFGTTEN